jgi:hypothetical protein
MKRVQKHPLAKREILGLLVLLVSGIESLGSLGNLSSAFVKNCLTVWSENGRVDRKKGWSCFTVGAS